MKKLTVILLAMLLAAGVFAAEKKTVIKFASVAPDGSTWMNIMEEFAEEVTEKTGGAVEFKFYPGGVSGDEKDVLRKMKINQINAAGFTSQGLGEVVKEVRLLNLPFMFNSYKQIDYVMEKMSPFFEAQYQKKGYTVLGWPEVGFAYVFSKDKVESLEDFRKVKMWIWGDDQLVNSLFKNIGIVPIPLALSDVNQSLQTGLIEGVYGSPLSAIAMQWNTSVKNMLNIKVANVPGGILINNKTWASLTDEQKKIIKEAGKKHFSKLTQASRKENEEAIAALKKTGTKISDIKGQEDIKVLDEVAIKTANDLVGKFYTKAQLDEMLGYIAQAKKEEKVK
ncbi:MAG: ABC transporter substrate-binding protein [Candidatus Goldiibacteriota bacterium HGW-Goldbacteria-1]|jgi:TRAP-type C4-dicarboxylate transport system substrate-binding protein|nr:MAG: ABC transporter substrate-binding protein [Candidatus Goldiibacteriota bacterium HGW-Goldbacteria-1]